MQLFFLLVGGVYNQNRRLPINKLPLSSMFYDFGLNSMLLIFVTADIQKKLLFPNYHIFVLYFTKFLIRNRTELYRYA